MTPDPIPLRRRRTTLEVVGDAFRIVRDDAGQILKAMLPIVAVPIVLNLLVSYVSGQLDMAFSLDALRGDPEALAQANPMFANPGWFVLSMVLSLVSSWLIVSASYAYVVLYQEGETDELTPAALWAATKPLLGPIAGLTISVVLAYLCVILLGIIPCLGAIASLVITVWALPVLMMLPSARVFDAHSTKEAFGRVRGLIKGEWGQSFGTALVFFLALMAFGIVLFLVIGAVAAVLKSVAVVLLALVSSVLSVWFYVAFAVAGTLMYFNLLELEGPELDERVDEIGIDADDEQPLF